MIMQIGHLLSPSIIPAILLCTVLVHATAQEAEKNYDEAFALIEVWLDAQRDYERLPGMSAIVVEDQEVLWKGAFGEANLEESVSASPSTLYSICSISKLFTAVAIMKLYDEGKLRLDDTVEDLLPWYNLEQQYAASGPITVRSLLTHSSGLPREANYPYWTGPDFPFPSREEVRDGMRDQETLYPASTYFQYSNLGLTLLGEIVEEVSGQSYDSFVQEHILGPLQLGSTRTELPEELYGEALAIGYSSLTREGEREKVELFQARGIKAAAGYSSNVEDLGAFASWQFRLRDTTTTEVLKPATLKNMQRVHWMDPDWGTSWGLGFTVAKSPDGQTTFGHGGSCPGYRSALVLFPKGELAFSVMINASGTSPQKYIWGMQGMLGKVEERKDAEELADLGDYIGYYNEKPWWGEAYIGSWNGRLVMLALPADQPAEAMTFFKHVEGDTFRRVRDDGELGEALIFQRDDAGKIIGYTQHTTFSARLNP